MCVRKKHNFCIALVSCEYIDIKISNFEDCIKKYEMEI